MGPLPHSRRSRMNMGRKLDIALVRVLKGAMIATVRIIGLSIGKV